MDRLKLTEWIEHDFNVVCERTKSQLINKLFLFKYLKFTDTGKPWWLTAEERRSLINPIIAIYNFYKRLLHKFLKRENAHWTVIMLFAVVDVISATFVHKFTRQKDSR